MDTEHTTAILDCLSLVEAERARRAEDPAWSRAVLALKRYQQRRFAHTHADLLIHPRYAGASRFFLDELYGPDNFSQRDAQFARVVPRLVRLFPGDVVSTVSALCELHALSERLDSQTARHLIGIQLDPVSYLRAWQACGEPPSRERQIELVLRVGRSLDGFTRNAVLRHTLRLMRVPAQAAGLSTLQSFLETGFETFREMRGSTEFLDLIVQRERVLVCRLFTASSSDTDLPKILP